jgi:hypothetical protein
MGGINIANADLITIDDNKKDNKKTQIQIEFLDTSYTEELSTSVSSPTKVFTYSLSEVQGKSLGHWNLILPEEILEHIVNVSPEGEVGKDGSTDTIGVKWDVAESFTAGDFLVELDQAYNVGEIDALVFAGGNYEWGKVMGPTDPAPVAHSPIPPTAWLFGAGLISLFGLKKKSRK